ncbi:MAG: DUF4097 domain-containing protein [Nocardioides sp.]|nr:DUF4097 domain-containing protein [Nocardioides sp.]
MSDTTLHRTFETPGPIDLYVENGRGHVEVTASDTTTTRLEITGERAEEFTVEWEGERLSVLAPSHRGGFLGREPRASVVVEVPHGSRLGVKTGSSDVRTRGDLAEVWARTGSGDVVVADLAGEVDIQTGSGAVDVAACASLHAKTGSGDVRLGSVVAAAFVATGSGDVAIGEANEEVAIKTGSGDAQVDRLSADLAFTTGSGDLRVLEARRGRMTLKTASGDLHLGVPAGTPVWTDLMTVSGRISSDLPATGEPAEGQDHLEVRGQTASGSITLHAR